MTPDTITLPVGQIPNSIQRGIHLIMTGGYIPGAIEPILDSIAFPTNERIARTAITLPTKILIGLTSQFIEYMTYKESNLPIHTLQQRIYNGIHSGRRSKTTFSHESHLTELVGVRNRMNCRNRPTLQQAPEACANCYFGPFIAAKFDNRSNYFNSQAGQSDTGCSVGRQKLALQMPAVVKLNEIVMGNWITEP
jgi:hypothetical protein